MKELQVQGIEDYEMWNGFILPSVKESINRSHKMIVEWALLMGLPEICICEDDIKFSHKDSWKFFLQNKPNEYDLYLGNVFLGDLDKDNKVDYFTGLTLYIIHSRFYETFLSVPHEDHLDRSLKGLGEFYVCNPFVCTQYDGVSSNTGKYESYEKLVKDRHFFNGT